MLKEGNEVLWLIISKFIMSSPEIITRGFVYVKEADNLIEEMRWLVVETIERFNRKRSKDYSALKSAIKNDLSGFLYKTIRRSPMIIPVVTEV